jgi:hypothetical protein
MASAGSSMSGLLSETACQFAGTMFDTSARTVHDELTAPSTNLAAAADQYSQVDEVESEVRRPDTPLRHSVRVGR